MKTESNLKMKYNQNQYSGKRTHHTVRPPFKIKRSFMEKIRDFFSGIFGKGPQGSNGNSSSSAPRLFIGNLSYQAKESDLKNLFGKYGHIQSVDIVVDRRSGQSKGFAFIEMGSAADATKALALNGTDVLGRAITVSEARAKGDSASRLKGRGRGRSQGRRRFRQPRENKPSGNERQETTSNG
jgi:cold-inducible RNA-binding protein